MHIFIKIVFLTISFNQLQAAPVSENILSKILGDATLTSCQAFNSFLNSTNEYFTTCNTTSSRDSQHNSFDSNQLLCLSFYDVNLRLCEMKNKYPKLALPTNVSQVVDFLKNFDSDPSVVKDFCSKSPEQVLYGNSPKLLDYATEFQDIFNETVSCNLMCIEQIVPKVLKIKPFCKIFLWGNLQLKKANTYLDNLAKTIQQSKILENASKKLELPPVDAKGKKLESHPDNANIGILEMLPVNTDTKPSDSQPDNINNEPVIRTGEKPQPFNAVTPGSVVANVTNIVNTTPDNVSNNSAKSAEAEKVVLAPTSVENPPLAPQPPVSIEAKPENANSNNQIDDMIDPDKDDYDNEPENEIGNSGLDDPLPQNPNESNESPIQLEPIHKTSLSNEKANKEIVFEKNFDTNPKMVITEGQFIEAENGHFFPFFLSAVALSVLAYVLLHNKKKVMALLIEGRQGNGGGRRRNSRGHAYRRLDTLEQAISSKSQTAPPTNIIY